MKPKKENLLKYKIGFSNSHHGNIIKIIFIEKKTKFLPFRTMVVDLEMFNTLPLQDYVDLYLVKWWLHGQFAEIRRALTVCCQ